MGTCKDCKYSEPGNYGALATLSCDHPKFLFGYSHNPKDMPPDSIMIENDEGWGCVVGPDFGCIHFNPKP